MSTRFTNTSAHKDVPTAAPAALRKYNTPVDIYAYIWESVQGGQWSDPQELQIWGRTRDGTLTNVIVRGFRPYFYVEIPDTIKWTRAAFSAISQFIRTKLRKIGIREIKIEECWKYRTFGLYLDPVDNIRRATFPFLKISFLNEWQRNRCVYNPESPFQTRHDDLPIAIPGVGTHHLFIHESDRVCDSVLQCTSLLDVPQCGWLQIMGNEAEDSSDEMLRYTTIYRRDMIVQIPDEETETWKTPRILVCSWDIEVLSSDDNRFPNAKIKSDCIIQIGLVFKYEGEPFENAKKVVLSYEKCSSISGIKVRSFRQEYGVIVAFAEEIRKHNPDVLVGYNTSGFDMNYMIIRAELNGVLDKLQHIGRLESQRAKVKKTRDRNHKEIKNLTIPGRICVDLLPWMRKQPDKLQGHRLDTVAEYYLNEHKDPVKHYDIFAHWRSKQPDRIAIVARYCIQDCLLVSRLMEHPKLQVWTELTELSHIMRTTISNIVSEGQQVRVYSQIYYDALHKNFVLEGAHTPRAKKFWTSDKYSGAIVLGNPGSKIFKNVATMDFKSLYPSVMEAYNIDPTTYVLENDIGKLGDKVHHLDFEDRTEGEVHFEYLKKPAGLFPSRSAAVLKERQATKRRMKDLIKSGGSKDLINRLDKRQLALKISANSMYGAMGAVYPMIPFAPGAKSITAAGRQALVKAVDFFKSEGYHVLYGDSVSGDTPVLVGRGPYYDYVEIQNIHSDDAWTSMGSSGKEYRTTPLSVWSDKGFTKIRRVIRHKTNKMMYRIVTPTGVVDVTEDHSLLRPNGVEVRPCDVKVGEELMHSKLPTIDIFGPKKGPAGANSQYITNGKLELARFFYRQEANGYHCSISTMFSLLSVRNEEDPIPNGTRITEIIKLGPTDDYVYDLETENHHFAAGIGRMVVHNTDSTFVSLGDDLPVEEMFKLAYALAKKANTLFPPPVELEMEDIWKWYMMFARKRYVAVSYANETGDLQEKPVIKGIEVVRRDNCTFLRQLYMKIIREILWNESSPTRVNHVIFDELKDLFQRRVPVSDLVITKEYRGNYSEQSMRTLPHVAIAKRKEERGEQPVVSGERIAYIFVERRDNPRTGEKILQSERVEDPEYYRDHPDEFWPELDYYVESQILKPVNTILTISNGDPAWFMDMAYAFIGYTKFVRSLRAVFKTFNDRCDFNEVLEPARWSIKPSDLRKTLKPNKRQAITKKVIGKKSTTKKKQKDNVVVKKRTQHKLTEFFNYHKKKFEESNVDYLNPE